MFIDLTSSAPQGLALYQQDKAKEYYSFQYSIRDTLYNFESLPYRAECILPYQTLGFKIRVRQSLKKKDQQLSFEYLYEPDFRYNSFMKAMQKMTTWYLKYKRLEKIIELPHTGTSTPAHRLSCILAPDWVTSFPATSRRRFRAMAADVALQ
ncbi:MAG: hypothetical protein JST36_00030 [Bacteroidetes bacterium]|nr:hypothetical protein [Bacteroidota bacterium]